MKHTTITLLFLLVGCSSTPATTTASEECSCEPGLQGLRGEPGMAGLAGKDGAPGQSIQGPAGNVGPTGPAGQDGKPGSIGPVGATGPVGSFDPKSVYSVVAQSAFNTGAGTTQVNCNKGDIALAGGCDVVPNSGNLYASTPVVVIGDAPTGWWCAGHAAGNAIVRGWAICSKQ